METDREDESPGEEVDREDISEDEESIGVQEGSSCAQVREEGNQGKRRSKAKFRGKVIKVICGFPGCRVKPMLEQNMKAHQVTVHGQIGLSKGQKTLDFFLMGGCSKKRGPDSGVGTVRISEEAVDSPDDHDVEEPPEKKGKQAVKCRDKENNESEEIIEPGGIDQSLSNDYSIETETESESEDTDIIEMFKREFNQGAVSKSVINKVVKNRGSQKL